jgi:CTP synthase (UTP-ammonia lyase)
VRIDVGLVGDRSELVRAHAAIPLALHRLDVSHTWVQTDTIVDGQEMRAFDAVWCVPGSPYRSMEGALAAIRYARENRLPFLGTCAGFQHALIEYARNDRGIDAAHAESSPDAELAIVTPLACALVNVAATVRIAEGSRLHAAYGALETDEEYQCRFGLDPRWRRDLEGGDLIFTAFDDAGEVRALELQSHPFFVATLFQPERAAFREIVPPLVSAFIAAARSRP